MKLSVIIPFMPVDDNKYKLLHETLDSCTGYDEVLVIENWKDGYAVPINFGLQQATGDFLMVMNDDLVWDGGSLKRLCDPEAVTSPKVNGKSQPFWGCSFCIPRWAYEKTGGLWEGYKVSYFDDADMYQVFKKADVPMYCNEQVNVIHDGGKTLHTFPDHNEFYEANHKIYLERWGKDVDF
jgi:GT2 family glycosyltransferase